MLAAGTFSNDEYNQSPAGESTPISRTCEIFFAYWASRSLISADDLADFSECWMYWRAPNKASETAPKLFEACWARECVSPCVSDPILANAAVRSCDDFHRMTLQKLANVKDSRSAIMIKGDFKA